MRIPKLWSLVFLMSSLGGVAPGPLAAAGDSVSTDNVTARLLSEVGAVAPGRSFWVALEFDIRDGWHTYWRNPGDSGQATKLVWTLPAGVTAGEIVWPAPHRFELPPLVNYGYAKHVMHLVEIAVPAGLTAPGTLALRAKASWLVCADVCIPESADLRLDLPVNAQGGAIDPAAASLFAAARKELPGDAPAVATARIADGRLVLTLGKEWGRTLERIDQLSFVPYEDGVIEYGAPQTSTRTPTQLDLSMKLGYQPPAGGELAGLLFATERGDGGPTTIPMQLTAALTVVGGRAAGGPQFTPVRAPGLGPLLLLAMLGGLVLNLMPCVFPVLSIKAIGLVEQAKKHPAAVRAKGLVFAAGVIGSMLLLASVLLALRAGGEQIGWGFQLQSPLFVTLMCYLLLGVGLNLSGVFEVGGGLAGLGDTLTQGDGYHASFFTGVLTTLVATPCTAPFMAAAVGAALTQSPAIALTIFASLGLGLSFPYLLLSFAPWLRRALPRPGAWMDTLKQVFAFPMYASAAWLLWVLAQQTAVVGLAGALAGAVLIGLAAWAYQKSKNASPDAHRGRVASRTTAVAALLLAIAIPVEIARSPAAAPSPNTGSAAQADGWQTYDAARLAQLLAAGKPVLVNFTASWCLTCLVNERNAFADADVQQIFRSKGVTLMKGDWTNRDPQITKALAAFNRAGVPLYIVYNAKPGVDEPVLLPQLLSAGIVRDAFAALPDRTLTSRDLRNPDPR